MVLLLQKLPFVLSFFFFSLVARGGSRKKMGQTSSSAVDTCHGGGALGIWYTAIAGGESVEFAEKIVEERDYTDGIPDECLAYIFQFLGSGDRKRCSIVCKRWL